jgi:Nif-specific regulatory protein
MNPRLIAVAGTWKGRVIELTGDEMSVGRDASNLASLPDRSISRQHCIIQRSGAKYKIVDLESHNGTFVNRLPVKEQVIKHGDRIQIGSTFFLFLEEEESPSHENVQFDGETPGEMTTVQFRVDDALYSLESQLGALLKISTTISSIRSLKALEQQLLESIFEILPAERGAILLTDSTLDAPHSIFSLSNQPAAHDNAINVSRLVAQRALQEGVAVVGNDIPNSETLSRTDSLMASKICSLLCVPLRLFDRIIGLIYLDTCQFGVTFNEEHLQVLTAIAGFASGALDSARRLEWLENENQRLNSELVIECNMVGESAPMKEVYRRIVKIAPTSATVLLRGASGTGKELAARAIHRNSLRAHNPFIAVNCAVFTESLLESELMGHEKGAFTGAIAQKKGKLELADGGTIFLDEVGEMSPTIQAKLLRVLQEREFERLGGTRPIKVDIRVIAATNRNLEEAVAQGNFRQDLYYRLNVVSLELPSLSSRAGDIQLLANYFTAKYSEKCKRYVMGISTRARDCLINYDWPGNVRELENAIEHAVVLGSTEYIEPEDLPEVILEKTSGTKQVSMEYYKSVKEAKRRIILEAVEGAGGDFSKAAELLGVHLNNLYRLIRNLDLKPMLNRTE